MSRRRWVIGVAAGVAVVAVTAAVFWWAGADRSVPLAERSVAAAAEKPTPTPTPTGPPEFPANTDAYDVGALPRIDVFAVLPTLPVDSDAAGVPPGVTARAVADLVPVFADPTGEPVAALPRDDAYDGTTVAVLEQQSHWARVMLTGRSTAPSTGQLTGWVRAQDVAFAAAPDRVEVDLAARTIDIVHADGSRETIATDFGYGAPGTPTPTGRSFLMLIRSEPSLEYTRGYPLVYLSAQSTTLAGFDGSDVAVTAFHYHDARSGDISNGCLRVAAPVAERLAQLPLGTAVLIR